MHTQLTLSCIGPRIGFKSASTLRIMLALPFNIEIHQITLNLYDENKAFLFSAKTDSCNSQFNVFYFDLTELTPRQKYFYEFTVDSKILSITNLNTDDLFFYSPDGLQDQNFCLLSCNNPFEFKEKKHDKYNMWKILDESTDRKTTGLIIYGGDQVYNDCIEEKVLNINRNTGLTIVEKRTQSLKLIIENYYSFWESKHIKRLHAQIPSLMMWDDHDITDGWGGRLDSFEGAEFKNEWQKFFEYAREAFSKFQTICNPDTFVKSAFSSFLDIGDKRFYLLDLRSEKNIAKSRLISDEHLIQFFSTFDSMPENIRHIFILSPVVPVRINPVLEEQIENSSKMFFSIRNYLKANHPKISKLITKTQLADLSDDISDGLTSKINNPTFLKILNFLYLNVLKNKKVTFITGDIHIGGLSEIIFIDKKFNYVIPQIVSSPIGYQPMATSVKNQTTEDEEIILSSSDDLTIIARNIKYVSQRNFSKIVTNQVNVIVEMHFEGSIIPWKTILQTQYQESISSEQNTKMTLKNFPSNTTQKELI